MQTAKVHKRIVEEVEKLNRKFLWSETEAERKIHLVVGTRHAHPRRREDWG